MPNMFDKIPLDKLRLRNTARRFRRNVFLCCLIGLGTWVTMISRSCGSVPSNSSAIRVSTLTKGSTCSVCCSVGCGTRVGGVGVEERRFNAVRAAVLYCTFAPCSDSNHTEEESVDAGELPVWDMNAVQVQEPQKVGNVVLFPKKNQPSYSNYAENCGLTVVCSHFYRVAKPHVITCSALKPAWRSLLTSFVHLRVLLAALTTLKQTKKSSFPLR